MKTPSPQDNAAPQCGWQSLHGLVQVNPSSNTSLRSAPRALPPQLWGISFTSLDLSLSLSVSLPPCLDSLISIVSQSIFPLPNPFTSHSFYFN